MIMLYALPDSWDQLTSTLLGTIALAELTPATIIPRIHEETAHRKEHGSSSHRLNVIKQTGVANALDVYDEYGENDFFAHIDDYDDETASNSANITFPSLNPPAEEARNFILKGICSGTIRPNGF
ncbi:hypothetical protein PAXRUDRAFT_15194 [Paxillus rubicundulus Ve08.2h10]|uniref:Uncharacterized protein n=1 Tax=Paxillus rubicundulus Ve08.2h10 TaxID=930991 RepID=A0A0D0DBR3_9AGAM|nr:hypothetical protein PAXRUDRAFT_15194 [Paxillus rubicundulus Ve08.2h10]